MLRSLILSISVACTLQAAVLPEQFADYRRGDATAVNPDNRTVWDEYGFQAAESAEYSNAAGEKFTLTAFRLHDPTGAYAAFQWQRPADAQSSATSASTPSGALIQYQNYLLRFEGNKPHPASLEQLYGRLTGVVRSSLPVLSEYLPKKGRIPNSERYLLGPASLALVEPRISGELASFGKGAEAQTAKYRTGGRELQLTVLSYPTPQIAIERTRAFQSLAGAYVRRTGPIILVIPEAAGFAPAEKLVAGINYNANFTWSEEVPKATVQDAAHMILAISALAGGLILLALVLGLFFGGSRSFLRRLGMKVADEELTTLHLGGK